MSQLLTARVAMMEISPNIKFNRNRTTFNDDYFKGMAPWYFNDLMRHLNLNASLVKSPIFGSCRDDTNCTGLYSILQNDLADFSLMSVPYTYTPGVQVIYGPYGTTQEASMLSLPIKNSTITKLDVFTLFTSTPVHIYLVIGLLFLILLVIINLFANSRSQLTFFSIYSNFFNRDHIRRPRLPHTIVAVLIYFFFITFLNLIINCSYDSNLIKKNPAEHFKVLNDLVKPLDKGKIQIYCIKNMRANSAMMARHEWIFKKLLSKMKYVSRRDINKIPEIMKEKQTVFIEIASMHQIVKNLFCGRGRNFSRLYNKLKSSNPVLVVHTAIAMSPKINFQLKKRVFNVFNTAFEANLQMKYFQHLAINSARNNKLKVNKLFNCQSKLEFKRYRNKDVLKNVHPVEMDEIGVLFKLQLFLWLIASVVHIKSIVNQKMSKKNKKRKPVLLKPRQNKISPKNALLVKRSTQIIACKCILASYPNTRKIYPVSTS